MTRSTPRLGLLGLLLPLLFALGALAPAQARAQGAPAAFTLDGGGWCGATERWQAKQRADAPEEDIDPGCPLQGTCDIPTARDAWLPAPGDGFITLALKFNIFASDSGSAPALSETRLAAQLDTLNADYAAAGIRFVATSEIIASSELRVVDFTDQDAVDALKLAHADQPESQLNVFVTNSVNSVAGVGTFPWDEDALTPLGGVIIDGGTMGADWHVLGHEIGHNLGLWHTHHGVSEVSLCSECYEAAGAADGDRTGDFCSDTPPTPVNFQCLDPWGDDYCGEAPWGDTPIQNFMSYTPQSCVSEFSPQQMARMRCWIHAALSGWQTAPVGGCCGAEGCQLRDEGTCRATGGRYLGDGSSCEALPGVATRYRDEGAPGAIPEGEGPLVRVLEVPESFILGDVAVDLAILHPAVGDLSATLSHGGVTVALLDRPGTGWCAAENMTLTLSDGGQGGPIQTQCQGSLTSPPAYTPEAPLAAFEGMDAQGSWILTLRDAAEGDQGALRSWGLTLEAEGRAPCEGGCVLNTECDDGDPCTTDRCGAEGLCLFTTDPIGAYAAGDPTCGDACPEDPAKSAPGICGCGVPEDDRDGDGLPDCQAEDTAPFPAPGPLLWTLPVLNQDGVRPIVGDFDGDGVDELLTQTGRSAVLARVDWREPRSPSLTLLSVSADWGVGAVAAGRLPGAREADVILAVGGRDGGPVELIALDNRTLERTGSAPISGNVDNHFEIVIEDVDLDGRLEAVVLSTSGLGVYDALTLEEEWSASGYSGSALFVGDLDGDGGPEIVVDGRRGRVIDPISQTVEWEDPAAFGDLMALGDLSGDSIDDIVVAQDLLLTAKGGLDQETLWTLDLSGDPDTGLQSEVTSLWVATIDGIPTVLVSLKKLGILGLRAADGETLWVLRGDGYRYDGVCVGEFNDDGRGDLLWTDAEDQPIGLGTPSLGTHANVEKEETEFSLGHLADLDGDGTLELLVAGQSAESFPPSLVALNLQTGALLSRHVWEVYAEVSALTSGDVDGLPGAEIVATLASPTAALSVLKGTPLEVVWEVEPPPENHGYVAVILVDWDGDGIEEIIAASNGSVTVYDVDERRATELPAPNGVILDFDVANLDDDPELEMLAIASSGVFLWDGGDTWRYLQGRGGRNSVDALSTDDHKSPGMLSVAISSGDPPYSVLELTDLATQRRVHANVLNGTRIEALRLKELNDDGEIDILGVGTNGYGEGILFMKSLTHPFLAEPLTDPAWGALSDLAIAPADAEGRRLVALIAKDRVTATFLIPQTQDSDEDGIPDGEDVCPRRADPNQADRDNDGVGDVCDVCPDTADPVQLDHDRDGDGDACDACPEDGTTSKGPCDTGGCHTAGGAGEGAGALLMSLLGLMAGARLSRRGAPE